MKTTTAPFGTATLGVKWTRIAFCGREKKATNNAFLCKGGIFAAVVNDTVVGLSSTMDAANKIFTTESKKFYGRVVRN